ncbi:MAG: formate--tetrahydrofolate ligase [Bryobacteraceae bacterium]
MRNILEAGAELGIEAGRLIPYGSHYAKVRLAPSRGTASGKLILVTGITPTPQGEGKTVTTIGLAQSMRRLGHRAVATIRQPSMGPVFGMKGGATGGGQAQVTPAGPVNLHFTGDFHAITSAHNLLSAMIDAHVFHGNELGIDIRQIVWPRTMDVNDRALRRIRVCEGEKDGEAHASEFVITAASEVMAVFALAQSHDDLRARLSRMVVAYRESGEAVSAGAIGTVGAMMALLRDALLPNLTQTGDGTPVLVHAGPFANIAHGTSSVVSQTLALEHADFVLNEVGFGSDLGAEKYMDIVMPASGLQPSAAVIVATVRAIALHGEGKLGKGLTNLGRHLEIVSGFGLPAVVALNRFPDDKDEDLATVAAYCGERGAPCGVSDVYARGAEGGLEVAAMAAEAAASGRAQPRSLYSPEMGLEEKLTMVARCVYGADGVDLSDEAKTDCARFTEMGFGHFPVCVAKTPLSFTADRKRTGVPKGWRLPVRRMVVSAGAGFVVAIAGATVRMPGLGKHPQALEVDLGPDGELIGVV